MTTTVKLITHSWPVDVTTTDRYNRTLHTVIETVPPETERTFYITGSRQIAFTELPLPVFDAEFVEVGEGDAA